MRTGLKVRTVATILNITTNYVYRLIREGQLELIQTEPMLVNAASVKLRLLNLVPFLASDLAISTDYQIRKYEVVA